MRKLWGNRECGWWISRDSNPDAIAFEASASAVAPEIHVRPVDGRGILLTGDDSMRKWLIVLIMVMLMTTPASAHPGRTDGSGGHYDRSTGDYHYHHGYGAHDHVDGVCPYDYDDKTGENSGSSSGSSSGSLKKNYDQAGLTSIYQTLRKGDRGNAVADLQKRLNTLGYAVGAADGVFGERTVAAVKQFQKDNDINATGNVSYATLAVLFPELAPTVTARPTTKTVAEPIGTTKPAVEHKDDEMLSRAYSILIGTLAAVLVIVAAYLISPARRKDKNHLIRHELDEIERQLNRIDDKIGRSKRHKSRASEVRDITEKIRALLDQLDA